MAATKSTPKKAVLDLAGLSTRLSDLESYVSDHTAHLANVETRIVDLKSNLFHALSNRVSDLESQSCDLSAHVADLEARLSSLKQRVKKNEGT